MPGLRFKDLLSAAGVDATYGGDISPEQQSSISQRAAKYLEKYPELAELSVRPDSADGFNYRDNVLHLSRVDPDVLAHEAEHAKALANDDLYKKVLAISRKASDISNAAALPALFGLVPMIDDPAKRRHILGILAGVNTALAVPNLFEEAKASTRVVMDSPDKLHSVSVLAPAFASHLLHDMYGTGLYLGGRSLIPETSK